MPRHSWPLQRFNEAEKFKAPKWNHSQVLAEARRILGPLARVWNHDGVITIGLAKGAKKVSLGVGKTYQQAFDQTFVAPQRQKEAIEKHRQEEMASALAATRTETPRESFAPPLDPIEASK